MRQHARFARLAPRIDSERFHRIVRAERLAAARLDPGYSVRIDNYGCLDLVFADGDDVQVVPYLILQGMMLFLREASPFVWPAWLPPLRADVLREIEAAVEPWLRSLAIARFVNGETVKFFDAASADVRELFARARAAGFLGAATTEAVLVSVSPYVFAQRFARDRRVAVVDSRGAGGAAILARVASVDVDLGDAALARDAARWFGLDVFERGVREQAYDVAIGDRAGLPEAGVRIVLDEAVGAERTIRTAHPIPLTVMTSFDIADGAEVRRFAVTAPDLPLRAYDATPTRVVGGSAGRIGLVVRDDYLGVRDADGDAALALAEHLNAQGFSAKVVGASHVRAADFDLLHIFGYRCAPALAAALARGGGAHPPLVVQPYLDDPKCEAEWGATVTGESLANAADEGLRDYYAGGTATRLLSAGSVEIGTSAAKEPIVANLLAAARAGIFSSEGEERRAREMGFTGGARIVPALLADEPSADPAVGSLAGLDDFVLVHGPIDPRCNQHAILRACSRLGYRAVLLGSVVNTEYYGDVTASLDNGSVYISEGDVSAAEVAALYRSARVFADASWTAAGLYRIMRAAAAGAALVVPSSGYARGVWPGHAQAVDPGSVPSIEQGLRTAWERADELGAALSSRTLQRYAPFEMLVLSLNAYQSAAAVAPT